MSAATTPLTRAGSYTTEHGTEAKMKTGGQKKAAAQKKVADTADTAAEATQAAAPSAQATDDAERIGEMVRAVRASLESDSSEESIQCAYRRPAPPWPDRDRPALCRARRRWRCWPAAARHGGAHRKPLPPPHSWIAWRPLPRWLENLTSQPLRG